MNQDENSYNFHQSKYEFSSITSLSGDQTIWTWNFVSAQQRIDSKGSGPLLKFNEITEAAAYMISSGVEMKMKIELNSILFDKLTKREHISDSNQKLIVKLLCLDCKSQESDIFSFKHSTIFQLLDKRGLLLRLFHAWSHWLAHSLCSSLRVFSFWEKLNKSYRRQKLMKLHVFSW